MTGPVRPPGKRDATIRYTQCKTCDIQIAASGRGRLPDRCQACKNKARRAKVAIVSADLGAPALELVNDRDGAVLAAMKRLAANLPSAQPAAEVLFEVALALCIDIDEAGTSPTHRANASAELRAVLAEILAPVAEEEVHGNRFGLSGLPA